MRKSRLQAVLCATLAGTHLACASGGLKLAELDRHAAPASPLGPSYVLVAQPVDAPVLLGKIVRNKPDDAASIENLVTDNPCLDRLEPPRESPALNNFEDAEELGVGASAQASLGRFGFEGDAHYATHLVYKLDTERRVWRTEGVDYAQCCREKDCGYGYVSGLVYGHGEYASATDADASAQVDLAIASAGGTVALKTLHKKQVGGYLAALVTPHAEAPAATTAPPPPPAPPPPTDVASTDGKGKVDLAPNALDEYRRKKMGVCPAESSMAPPRSWVICEDPQGARTELTEHAFASRYHDVTGFTDLAALDRSKNEYLLWAGGASGVIGITGWVMFFAFPRRPPEQPPGCPSCTPIGGGLGDGQVIGLAVGGVGTLFAGIFLIMGFTIPDGVAWNEHELTDHDAMLAISRYNRALARKLANGQTAAIDLPVAKRPPSFRIAPFAGSNVIGLQGAF